MAQPVKKMGRHARAAATMTSMSKLSRDGATLSPPGVTRLDAPMIQRVLQMFAATTLATAMSAFAGQGGLKADRELRRARAVGHHGQADHDG